MKVWELDSKANDVTRSKMLTKSATFHQNNARCHHIKSKQKFLPVSDADTLLILKTSTSVS